MPNPLDDLKPLDTPPDVEPVPGAGDPIHEPAVEPTQGMSAETMLRDQWDFWQTVFQPLEQDMLEQVMLPPDIDYQQRLVSQDLAQGARRADEMTEREFRSQGMDFQSPEFDRVRREIEMLRTAADAGARTGIVQSERDQQLQRLGQVSQLGQNIPAQSVSALNNIASAQAGIDAGQAQNANALVNLGVQGVNLFNPPAATPAATVPASAGAAWTSTPTPGYDAGSLSLGGGGMFTL